MWNLDRRRWEKGASASEMEAFIFLFCWSANALKGKGKKARREKLIPKKRNHFIPDHKVKPISLFGLVQVAILGYCLFISEDMEDRSYVPVASHFCSQCSFLEENSIYFWQSFTDALFSLCHLWWKHMCDHGQGFPFLKCLLLLLLCQCVSEENDSWKRPLFGFALSMETGPLLGLGGQQATFTSLLALSRSSPTGWTLLDTPVSGAPLCCPCFPEHWARVRPWRKGLIRSGEQPLAPYQPLLIEEKIEAPIDQQELLESVTIM